MSLVAHQSDAREADIAAVAALVSDRTRAAILLALMDGETHSSGDLARQARVAPSTASGHLARLLRGGLVTSAPFGRERRYRLASAEVAHALEALALLAPPTEIRTLRAAERGDALRLARTCYDHLAGRLGVGLTQAFLERDALRVADGGFALTEAGEEQFASIGVDFARARAGRRTFAGACLDWSERRPHLAGALGAGLAEVVLARGWVRRRPDDRGLVITSGGERAFRELGVELS